MPVIDPFVADEWIVARLSESTDLAAIISNRIHPMRQDFAPVAWPYVLYAAPSQVLDSWADMITLGRDEYRVYAVMREDKLSAGVDIEDFLKPAYIAIMAALDGVSDSTSPGGTVHSCNIVGKIRRYYGEETKHVCEMGVVVRIVSS